MTAGYSGTPLGKKLGLKPGLRIWIDPAMPETVRAEIDPTGIGVDELPAPAPGIDAAHVFVTREDPRLHRQDNRPTEIGGTA